MKKQLFFVLALIGLMLMGGGINLYADTFVIDQSTRITDANVSGKAEFKSGSITLTITNEKNKPYLNGSQAVKGIKYSAGVKYTINLIEGMVVSKISFESCTNYPETSYIGELNGTKYAETDYVIPNRSSSGVKYSIDLPNVKDKLTFTFQGTQVIAKITLTYTITPAKSFSLTTADTEPYSLYLDYPVAIPEGIEAYTGTLDAKEETLTMKKVEGTIPANTAVIVKSATADTYEFKETYAAASIESNSLKGVTADTDITELAPGKTLLTLGTKGGKVAFRKPATGTTQVKANKAYLLVNTPSGEGAKTVKMIFDGETTGISEFTANEDATNAPLFNLNGQRVNANAKGLLIKNGKKIIIK